MLACCLCSMCNLNSYVTGNLHQFTIEVIVNWWSRTNRDPLYLPLRSPSAVFREATTDFTVDARPLSRRGGDHVKAEVRNPSGALTDCQVTDKADGTYGVEYTPFENGSAPAPELSMNHVTLRTTWCQFPQLLSICPSVTIVCFRRSHHPGPVRRHTGSQEPVQGLCVGGVWPQPGDCYWPWAPTRPDRQAQQVQHHHQVLLGGGD